MQQVLPTRDSRGQAKSAGNVLYLSPYFWPEEIGSAPYCTDLARWLQNHGHAVTAISFRPNYPSAAAFPEWGDGTRDKEEHQGIKIHRTKTVARGKAGLRERAQNDVHYLFGVLRLYLSGSIRKPAVVVAYVPSIFSLLAGVIVGRLARAKVIGIVHDIESGLAKSLSITTSGLVYTLIRTIERYVLNRANHVVVLTEAMKRELKDIGCCREISVIPIWADVPLPQATPEHDSTVLMYSGNFGKKQNLEQLLPFIRRLATSSAAVRVVMQGEGTEKARIQALVNEIPGAPVEFRPLVPKSELVASLQSADIHLVTQALDVGSYALPSKLISIMAAGRPYICIAQKRSTLDDLTAKSQAGLCVEPGNEQALYDAVIALSSDDGQRKRLGENGRRFVELEMGRERVLERYGVVLFGESAAEQGAASAPAHMAGAEN